MIFKSIVPNMPLPKVNNLLKQDGSLKSSIKGEKPVILTKIKRVAPHTSKYDREAPVKRAFMPNPMRRPITEKLTVRILFINNI